MKTGDLVRIRSAMVVHSGRYGMPILTALVINVWRNHKRQILSADLLFPDGTTGNLNNRVLEVIS